MASVQRQCQHQYFLAECARCDFAVEGEIVNGNGGWKSIDWDAYSRNCAHRNPAGRPTMVCPHLRTAKLAAQPLDDEAFHRRASFVRVRNRQADCDSNLEIPPLVPVPAV